MNGVLRISSFQRLGPVPTWIGLAGSLLLAGCTEPAPVTTPVNKLALETVLSELVMHPRITCEELRIEFGLFELEVVETPDEAGLDFEEHWVATPDDEVLRVWYLPAALDRGTVVYSIGAVGEIPCYLFTARMLVHNGWSVVLYDYRGFGGSSGQPDLTKMALDLNTVIDWTLAYTGKPEVTLLGLSIGTIPTVAVAVERPADVNGVVLDSPVALGETVERFDFVLRDQTDLFLSLIDPALVSEGLIDRLQDPSLIILGDGDTLTKPRTVELLFERAPEPKRLARFSGVGHARARFEDTGTYASELERFLSSIWSQHVPFETQTIDPTASP